MARVEPEARGRKATELRWQVGRHVKPASHVDRAPRPPDARLHPGEDLRVRWCAPQQLRARWDREDPDITEEDDAVHLPRDPGNPLEHVDLRIAVVEDRVDHAGGLHARRSAGQAYARDNRDD